MRLFFSFFLFFTLTGCSLIQSSPSTTQTVSAISQGETKRIFWLDEILNQPEKLTELAMLGDYGQYQAEYRWRDGNIREIERLGTSLVEGETKIYSLLIRYDEKGQAIYQKYVVNDEIFPLKQAQLLRYYQDAQQSYDKAKTLNKNNQQFFQGHVTKNRMVDCTTGKEKILTLDSAEKIDLTEENQTRFIAAVGGVNLVRNYADSIIAIKDAQAPCFLRPEFEDPR